MRTVGKRMEGLMAKEGDKRVDRYASRIAEDERRNVKRKMEEGAGEEEEKEYKGEEEEQDKKVDEDMGGDENMRI